MSGKGSQRLKAVTRWFDSEADSDTAADVHEKGVDWLRILPFVILHVACFGISLRPHDLRRHAATYASRAGTPIEIVSKVILRHANLDHHSALSWEGL